MKKETLIKICFIAAGIFAIFSIFDFFGAAFSLSFSPSVFQLMFGGKTTIEGYTIEFKQFGSMVPLFVLEIFIIALFILGFILIFLIGVKSKSVLILSILLVGFNFTVTIYSFCTSHIVGMDQVEGIKLGVGPCLYSLMQLLSMFLLVFAIILFFVPSSFPASSDESRDSKNNIINVKKVVYRSLDKENKKADLIIKYKKMLDDGVITKEDFDFKKNQLLKS